MIALPGLTLATKRFDVAKSILTEFSKHISKGMLPNRFPDEGETPDYNTVDATLWYFEAIRAYVEATDDVAFVKETLYDKLIDIIDWHIRGTRFGIRVDTDGLLHAGEQGTQLTWMDAKVGNTVFTPRIGKPVEIQALWYNALRIMSELATQFDNAANATRFDQMADIARESFNGQFWNAERGCLFDVVDDNSKDESIRPNQIFAVSLEHSMLSPERARSVVDLVEGELLTPFGLRSLSPNDISFAPIYIGSPFDRDSAYHQGTVWAWLIGPFVDAYRKTHSQDAKAKETVDQMLSELKAHLNNAMLGSISEIFDATEPFYPRGCAAQAWSVAELLRVSKG
jgi:predicted glycogen debranching enzyme